MKKFTKTTAFLMALTMLMGGCSSNTVKENSQAKETVSGNMSYSGSTVTVEEIKKAYAALDENEIMPLYNVSETESFTFDFNFSFYESDLDLYDLVSIHTQSDCLEESMIYYNAEIVDNNDGTSTLTVAPMSPVMASEYQEENYIYEEIDNWGNAPMYYIAVHYDMETEQAEKLENPTVIPFTVRHDINAPNAKGVVNAQGRLKLEWEPVENAEKYNIYKLSNGELYTGENNGAIDGAAQGYDGGNAYLHLLYDGETTECYFDNFAGEGHGLAEVYRENGRYWCSGQNYCVNGEYYVTAVVDGKESGLSAAIPTCDLILPYKMTDESDILFANYPSAADFPATVEVLNIDGSVTTRNVIYDGPYIVDVYGYEVIQYNYVIEGTALAGYVIPDDENAEHVTLNIMESNDTGNAAPQDNIDMIPDNDVDTIIPVEPESTPEEESAPEESQSEIGDDSIVDENAPSDDLISEQIDNTQEHIENANDDTVSVAPEGVYVNADSAEEEWLALNMIEGNTEISLEAFPALQDPYHLVDVFNKVYYQNPYILGVVSYEYDYQTMIFKVNYVYDKEEIAAKQQEIMNKADEIIAEYITDDMSDEEKVKAIYDYLVNNCVYDDEALAAAEESNFKKTDSDEFEDAFNTYGTLVNGKGVCMSYAYTFRLLCDLSSIECVVTTGYLDGNLPHAWNMVKIGEQWYEVDATNNAVTMGIPYFLFQADSELAAATGYTKDEKFEIDDQVDDFSGDDESLEYYNSNELTADSFDKLKSTITENVDDTTEIFAIRWYGEEIDEEELYDAVNLAFNELGLESKLATTGYVITNGFIVLVIK